jgi:hypothetical protein
MKLGAGFLETFNSILVCEIMFSSCKMNGQKRGRLIKSIIFALIFSDLN